MSKTEKEVKTETTENTNTVAQLEAEETKIKTVQKLDKITDDGKKHKQGEVVKVNAFGVVIETKF